MSLTEIVQGAVPAVAAITVAMALVALVEMLIPLRARGRVGVAHLVPNLTLTLITFATNAVLNALLIGALVWLQAIGFGLLHVVALDPVWATVVVVLALDFAFYAVHVAMHEVPGLWRFHRVHHSDALVDVTTTIRQHPGEGVFRYGAMAVVAFALGAGPAAFAVYRVWSALQGLIEHANVRLPLWLDSALALVISSPNMHKVHHSRDPELTDRNFGNITSLWDRLFFTYTPASRGADIDYGLDGFDARSDQSTWGLLASPWRRDARISNLVEGNP